MSGQKINITHRFFRFQPTGILGLRFSDQILKYSQLSQKLSDVDEFDANRRKNNQNPKSININEG